MICNPEAVVMVFPAVCAIAEVGTDADIPASTATIAMAILVRMKNCIVKNLPERIEAYLNIYVLCPGLAGTDAPAAPLISERATILARIGTAGERAFFPVDPDRLTAAKRRDDLGGLVAELL